MWKIKPATLKAYAKAVYAFNGWAKANARSLVDHKKTDESMCAYIRFLAGMALQSLKRLMRFFGWIRLRSNWHVGKSNVAHFQAGSQRLESSPNADRNIGALWSVSVKMELRPKMARMMSVFFSIRQVVLM